MNNLTNQIASVAALALAALPLVAIGGIAHAAPATVQISDLDLSSAEGKAQFDARVHKAARKFCADRTVTGTRISVSHHCVAAVKTEMNDKLALAQQVNAKSAAYASR